MSKIGQDQLPGVLTEFQDEGRDIKKIKMDSSYSSPIRHNAEAVRT